MAKLGFIGTGHMAGTMVRHLAPQGHDITVTRRGTAVSSALEAAFSNVRVAGPRDVVAASDTVFVCLRPGAAEEGLEGLPFRAEQTVISVMAGIGRDTLADWCAPAARITLMLPMELIERGGCPIIVWPDPSPVEALFAPANDVIAVPDEASLAACFAATTLVSAVAETLDVGAAWLAERIGAEPAQRFAGPLISGMLDVHAGQDARFAALRDSLATPGTLNREMVERLRARGLPGALRDALDALEG